LLSWLPILSFHLLSAKGSELVVVSTGSSAMPMSRYGSCSFSSKFDEGNITWGWDWDDKWDTITAMPNLAATYQKLGMLTEAEKLEIQVLNARTRILGPEHPDTIRAIRNVATTYQKLGKYSEAKQLQTPISGLSTKASGEEHSKVTSTIMCFKVQSSSVFYLETRQLATATGVDRSRY
jgi:hypothetical protein